MARTKFCERSTATTSPIGATRNRSRPSAAHSSSSRLHESSRLQPSDRGVLILWREQSSASVRPLPPHPSAPREIVVALRQLTLHQVDFMNLHVCNRAIAEC